MRTWILPAVLLTSLFALAIGGTARAGSGGVPVDPNAKDLPPPPPPERTSVTPPECVTKVLNAVYEKEKEYFAEKKAYTDSLLEAHALSAVGVGCSGWSLPALASTYGGSGYTATMEDSEKGIKWTINQDKAMIREVRELKPVVPAAVPPAKK
jgi:hypothetical protein